MKIEHVQPVACLSLIDVKESATNPEATGNRAKSKDRQTSTMTTQIASTSITPAQSTPDAKTTTFVDDTTGVLAEPILRTELISSIIEASHIPGSETIVDFLRKPTRIASGTLSTTDTTKIFEVDPFYQQLIGIKSYKLTGIGLIRADIVVRLEVNAVRFQAGRYILGFVPSGGYSTPGFAAFYKMHTFNLMTITQLPHVEIDLATQTHVTLRIPFISSRAFIPASTTLTNYGTLFLVPYSPLVSGAAQTTAQFTCWASFENVSLSAPALPQSSFKVTPARQEQQKAGVGPVSGIAAKVKKTAGILGEFPLLSAPMQTVSWLSDVVGRAATVWGFSKPVVLSAPNRVVRDLWPYQANADQQTTAQPLSVVAQAESILHSGISNTTADEMSFDFIKAQYAYFGKFNWTTAQTTDTVLATYAHKPFDYFINSGKGFTMTPVCFYAQTFDYWRGGMKFRFKLVKTEFHSGRIMVTYTPNFDGASPVWTAAASEYLYREIIDIRTCSEFEVEIPFVQPDPWVDHKVTVGVLNIVVVDELVAPDSVSSTVPIIVEVAGAEDFECAVPSQSWHEPWVPAVAMSSYEVVPKTTLGTRSDNPIAAAATIGEKVTSFRQLLKRTQHIPLVSNPLLSLAVGNSSATCPVVFPTMTTPVLQDPTLGNNSALVRSTHYNDLYGKLSPCYLFAVGGFNVRCADVNRTIGYKYAIQYGQNYTVNSGMQVQYPGTPVAAGTNTGNTYLATKVLADTDLSKGMDVTIPFYSRRLARITHNQFAGTADHGGSVNNSTAQGSSQPYLMFAPVNAPADATTWTVYRPIADDAGFSMWLGVPPMVSWVTA